MSLVVKINLWKLLSEKFSTNEKEIYRKMNSSYIISGLFFFFTCSINLAAQQDSINEVGKNKPVPAEITSYFNSLRQYPSKMEVTTDLDTMSETRLKKIARRMYEVSEKDAEAASFVFNEENKLADSLTFQKQRYNKDVQIFVKPALVEHYFYEKIKKEMPQRVYATIVSDYLLKVTVKSIDMVQHTYKNEKDGITEPITQIDIKATVEEIIKGNTRFSAGQEITFYYAPWWRKGNEFKIGETCFVPLEALVDPEWNQNLIFLRCSIDNSEGRYPVINNQLIDKDNYFGYGNKVPWVEFRNNLIDLINTIKSW